MNNKTLRDFGFQSADGPVGKGEVCREKMIDYNQLVSTSPYTDFEALLSYEEAYQIPVLVWALDKTNRTLSIVVAHEPSNDFLCRLLVRSEMDTICTYYSNMHDIRKALDFHYRVNHSPQRENQKSLEFMLPIDDERSHKEDIFDNFVLSIGSQEHDIFQSEGSLRTLKSEGFSHHGSGIGFADKIQENVKENSERRQKSTDEFLRLGELAHSAVHPYSSSTPLSKQRFPRYAEDSTRELGLCLLPTSSNQSISSGEFLAGEFSMIEDQELDGEDARTPSEAKKSPKLPTPSILKRFTSFTRNSSFLKKDR